MGIGRGARRGARAGAAALLLCAGAAAGSAAAGGNHRGWSYLVDKLAEDGLDRARVARVFADARVPAFDGLYYQLAPREPASTYRGLLAASSVAQAKQCRKAYREAFDAAERRFEVPAALVAAILHVETRCGRYTGRHRILPRLARLAMANAPDNRRRNIEWHLAHEPDRPRDEVVRAAEARALVLENIFYPEVRAAFTLADRLKIDPLAVLGSSAGAFGIPQFLPTSYERFAVDGNGNGRVSLYEPADAIWSCANYLVGHGWRAGVPPAEQRSVIWEYNRSQAYIDAVLELARRLGDDER